MARAFGRSLQVQGKAYDCYFLYGPQATWDLDNSMSSEPDDFNALLDGWFPTNPAARFTKNRGISLPTFSPQVLTDAILEMLSEPSDSETSS